MNDFPKPGQMFDWLGEIVKILDVSGEGENRVASVELGVTGSRWQTEWSVSDWFETGAHCKEIGIEKSQTAKLKSVISHRIIAVSNDVTTCECCGKANLAKTVVIQELEDGAPMGEKYFGVVCAAKHTRAYKRHFNKVVRRIENGWITRPVQIQSMP